jgi:hypothetical protein
MKKAPTIKQLKKAKKRNRVVLSESMKKNGNPKTNYIRKKSGY